MSEKMKHGSRYIDLTGRTFGRLTVLGDAGRDSRGKAVWHCVCECGQERVIAGYVLRSGQSRSCGCLRSEVSGARLRKHGRHRSVEWRSWSKMIRRCTDATCDKWKYYGGRGVRVCDRWMNSFQTFFDDVGPAPSSSHTLDRIETNGHYETGNVRWATKKQQMRNTRSNKLVAYRGETKTLAEWSEVLGISYAAIGQRIRNGWSAEEAFTKPVRGCGTSVSYRKRDDA